MYNLLMAIEFDILLFKIAYNLISNSLVDFNKLFLFLHYLANNKRPHNSLNISLV